MADTEYKIAHAASVVVVVDGKRKVVEPGNGHHFTQDELATVAKAVPGALRKPVNESAADIPEAPAEAKGKAKSKPAAAPTPAATADEDDDDI